ncbi:MAG: SDR family oxidoreductase [Motiliproteus sp.]
MTTINNNSGEITMANHPVQIDQMNIDQMNIILTGSCGGIGREAAMQLSRRGARIIAIGRDSDRLQQLLDTLEPHRSQPHQRFCLDLCNPQQRLQLIQKLNKQQLDQPQFSPNVLINLAGINQLALFEQQTPTQIEQLIDINLTATLLLTHCLLPLLRQQASAQIINVGSTFGSIGYPGYVSYCTTKFALRGFTEALQRELSDSVIRVQYFAPRATKTPLNSRQANQLNDQLHNATDDPETVAQSLLLLLTSNRSNRYLGWPERLFVKLNALFPALVGGSIRKQLPLIKHYAGSGD